MTKKQFEETNEPLMLICSLDPHTSKVLYDTYDWRVGDDWVNKFEKDFPTMVHFHTLNKAAISERKKQYNLTD